jgi:YD repeat-containing protein
VAETQYRYRAFVSYRHADRDRRWARWLVEKLETFRTPRALVRQGAPLRIGQLFRDDDEIPASSDLSHQIEDALRASQFLIVVCSRDTPASKWVRKEIAFFRALGRGDRILALLVDGEPEDAFPPELLQADDEPIAADVRPRKDETRSATERRAFLRIAAGLLGVRFDDLARREHQRRVRTQRLWGAIAAALVLGASAASYGYWDYNRTKTRYYADFETRWGVPFGIGELDATTVSHRHISYEIKSRQGLIVNLRQINGSGAPQGAISDTGTDIGLKGTSTVEMRFPYPAERANQIDLYDAHGRLAGVERYSFAPDGGGATVTLAGDAGNAEVLDAASAGRFGIKSTIAQYRLVFDAHGLVTRRSYQTVWGTQTRDSDGTAGQAYTHYPDGHMRSTEDLLPGGTSAALRVFDYSRLGDRKRTAWLDGTGHPVAGASGYASRDYEFDPSGNATLITFRDAGGRPTSYTQMRYDPHGNVVERRYLNAARRPGYYGGQPYGRVDMRYDALGRLVSESYFDPTGKPTYRESAKRALSSDERMDFHRQDIRYDTRGYIVERRYFDDYDKPFSYLSRIVYTYDDRGDLIHERYYDSSGKLALMLGLNLAGFDYRPDAHGRDTGFVAIGTDGHPTHVNNENFVETELLYDERGNPVAFSVLGKDHKPTIVLHQHYARLVMRYDDHGNMVERDYLGTDGKPILNADGAAKETFAYDDHGNRIGAAYFGASGEPILRPETIRRVPGPDGVAETVENGYPQIAGYASLRLAYDRGRLSRIEFFGTDGHPILASYGGEFGTSEILYDTRCARIEFGYDSRMNPSRLALFGLDGRPIFDRLWGASSWSAVYDGYGRRLQETWFGADGKPTMLPSLKAAHVTYKYGKTRDPAETDWFDAHGKLLRVEH